MTQFLSEQFAATLAGELQMRLHPPHECGKQLRTFFGRKVMCWYVSGILPLKAHGETGKTVSRITIFIPPDWIEAPPWVVVHEDFIRKEMDWHAYADGGLCYVLNDEWRDRLKHLADSTSSDISRIIDFAATWLLAATDSLTTRHLFGARHGIKKWPADWEAYAHGADGVREYQRENGIQK